MRLTLDQVLNATRGTLLAPGSQVPAPGFIAGVSTDTRTLRPGDLFVALCGPHADGHEFVAEAFRQGASASLVGRRVHGLPSGMPVILVQDSLAALAALARYYRRALDVTVVGITGSVGKTTTAAMCAGALGTRFAVARTKDEWNAEIGVPLTLLSLERDHQVAVIEMAMRGVGQIAHLVEIARPQIGVVTAIGESHLELLGTREAVARAKGELVEGLPSNGAAVLNADDLRVAALASRSRARVITYGLDRPADVRGRDVAFTDRGMRFRLEWRTADTVVEVPAWGRHNVSNALAAAAVGFVLGLDPGAVREGLMAATLPKMRLQVSRYGDVLIINDAYNASPTSMEAAFEVLDALSRGRRAVAVLGEMKELGSESGQMHREVGRSLARRQIALLVTVERGGDQIAEGAVEGGVSDQAIVRMGTVEDAANRLPDLLRPGDVVLVKGSRALAMERIVDRLCEVLGAGQSEPPRLRGANGRGDSEEQQS